MHCPQKLLTVIVFDLVYTIVISCLFEVKSKLIPRGAVDDLVHYCARPKAECNSASGRPLYQGVIVDYTTNRHEITVLLPNPFDEKQFFFNLAAFLAWSCCRGFGFVAEQKISPNLLNFGLKMFCSF